MSLMGFQDALIRIAVSKREPKQTPTRILLISISFNTVHLRIGFTQREKTVHPLGSEIAFSRKDGLSR
jgi:hypothetical protein